MNFIRQRFPRSVPWWKSMTLILVALAACCVILGKVLMITSIGPTWRGITVGRSTADDVVAVLGAPTSVEREAEQTTYLYREGRLGEHRIVLHDDVVEYIVEDALAYPHDTFLRQLVDRYSVPDHVTWSGRTPSDRIAIFLDDGVFAAARLLPVDEAIVGYMFYFRPRSLARLLVDFKDEISLVNPFPDSDVIGSRDPWFDTP